MGGLGSRKDPAVECAPCGKMLLERRFGRNRIPVLQGGAHFDGGELHAPGSKAEGQEERGSAVRIVLPPEKIVEKVTGEVGCAEQVFEKSGDSVAVAVEGGVAHKDAAVI